ncbi:hypothetical protein TWF481_008782 [Arthrobotrys musiformis]|uniref:F-box domain-containing protein n=1 Tax=Arthrobotrys musiformis TaxID=47236 RepID=A0AAV9W942_9PEZI
MASLSSLPIEIKLHLSTYLHSTADLKSLTTACSNFGSIVGSKYYAPIRRKVLLNEGKFDPYDYLGPTHHYFRARLRGPNWRSVYVTDDSPAVVKTGRPAVRSSQPVVVRPSQPTVAKPAANQSQEGNTAMRGLKKVKEYGRTVLRLFRH